MSGEIVLFDTKALEKKLKAFEKAGGDLTPTMEIVAEGFVSDVNDLWESAGNGTWPDLADSTKAHRRGTTYQILKDTGRAAQSVQAHAGADFAEASTDVDYMKFHVGDAPRTKIPKRDPFDLGPESIERATEVILARLAAADQK